MESHSKPHKPLQRLNGIANASFEDIVATVEDERRQQRVSTVESEAASVAASEAAASARTSVTSIVSLDPASVPELMRTNSSKRILNQRPSMVNTKKFRMRSLLWVKPSMDATASSIRAQLLPTLIVNLAALSSGLSMGYSAIAIPQLKPGANFTEDNAGNAGASANSSVHRPFVIDVEEGSWIASIFCLGAVFGGFCAAFVGSRYGRRKTLLVMAVPDVIGWTLIAAAHNCPMMLIGGMLCGFAAAGYVPSIQIYIAEIAQPQFRGWLSAVTVPTVALGSLLAYSLGAATDWYIVAAAAAVVPVLLAVGLAFVPDSPYWYLQKQDEKAALKVMGRFRSADANALAELLAIAESLRGREAEDEQAMGASCHSLGYMLAHRRFRKPFLVLNGLFVLMTFSGKYAISFYAVDIFREASDGLNEYLSTIVIGAIETLGALLYVPAIMLFRRRALLVGSSLTMGAAMAVMGLVMYSHSADGHLRHALHDLFWLPLLCVTVFMVAVPLGLGSVPFLYTAEFYPSSARAFLGGVSIGLANLEMCVAVKTFPNLASSATIGSHGTFWLYAASCVLAALFTLMYVPETRGRSLEDIEEIFSRKDDSGRATPYVTPYMTPRGTPHSGKRGAPGYHPRDSLRFTL